MLGTDEEGVSADARHAAIMAGMALRTLSTPEDIARAALFLASDDARTITGQSIIVDAGGVGVCLPANGTALADNPGLYPFGQGLFPSTGGVGDGAGDVRPDLDLIFLYDDADENAQETANGVREATLEEFRFHVGLAQLAGNSLLDLFLRIIVELFRRHWSSTGQAMPSWSDVVAVEHAHLRILEAIGAGDDSLARYRIRRHLDAAASWWL